MGASEIFRSRSVIAGFHANFFREGGLKHTTAPFQVERPNYPLPAGWWGH